MGPIRIGLADDHEVFVDGLRVVLDGEHDMHVVGVAHDGPAALRLVTDSQPPDVLLLDVHMPGTDSGGLVRDLKRSSPATKVLMLSADDRAETVSAMLAAGADGFLPKNLSSRQVTATLRQVAAGERAPIFDRRATGNRREPEVHLGLRSLSRRERQVLELLVGGCSNQRIAEECCLSPNTVRTHVQNVLVKLGVHSKLEAAAFAVQHGVVPAGGRTGSNG